MSPLPDDLPAAKSRELGVDLLLATGAFTRAATRAAWSGPSSQWRALAMLERMGPARITALAQEDRVSQPTASAMMARLERQGLAYRFSDPADRRAQLIDLTGAGHARLADLRERGALVISPHLDQLGPADRAALERAVQLVRQITAQL